MKKRKNRVSKEEFIKKAIEKFGNNCDYTNINFVNMHTKISIKCNLCGKYFEVTPTAFLIKTRKHSCVCQYERYIPTTEGVIKKLSEIYGDKYDYSYVNYINSNIRIKLYCKIHNRFFEQLIHHLLNGYGCRKCGQNYTLTVSEFIEMASKVHNNKYNYEKVDFKWMTKEKITIICPIHGEFQQVPLTHIKGMGCGKCANNLTSNTEEFIAKAKLIHGDEFDYSSVNYEQAHKKITIICKKHGPFQQAPTKHLSGRKCPKCKSSKGEIEIFNWLKENKIDFITEKSFDGCKYKSKLRFDFYIPSKNLCLEYDGEQHHRYFSFSSKQNPKEFELLKTKDEIKNKFCKDNNIELIRIPYWDFDNISSILSKIFI